MFEASNLTLRYVKCWLLWGYAIWPEDWSSLEEIHHHPDTLGDRSSADLQASLKALDDVQSPAGSRCQRWTSWRLGNKGKYGCGIGSEPVIKV